MAGCCCTLSHGYTIVGHVSKGCLKKKKNRLISLHQVQSEEEKKIFEPWLCIECHLKQTQIQKTPGVTFKLPLTPC